jgi:hypothetical protein
MAPWMLRDSSTSIEESIRLHLLFTTQGLLESVVLVHFLRLLFLLAAHR